MRAVIYSRLSQEERDRERKRGTSIENQVSACRAHCERHGYSVVAVERDDGFSAGTFERPGFRRVLELVRSRRVDVIVSKHFDRLSRDLAAMTDLWERTIIPAGVSLSFVMHDTPDLMTSEGRLLFQITMMVAENQRRVAIDKSWFLQAEKLRKKEHPGGMPPMGYSIGRDKRLHIVEDQAKIVREAFDEYVRVGSLMHVVHWLNERYARPNGNKFVRGHLDKMLSNPTYIGTLKVVRRNGTREEYENYHPAILDVNTFAKAQGLRNLGGKKKGPDTGVWLLDRVPLIEGASGLRLAPHYAVKNRRDGSKTRYRYYRVNSAFRADVNNARTAQVAVKAIPADSFERWILEKLAAFTDDPKVAEYERDLKDEIDEFLTIAREQIGSVEKTLERCRAAMTAMGMALLGQGKGVSSTARTVKLKRKMDELEALHIAWHDIITELQRAEGDYDHLSRTLRQIALLGEKSLFKKQYLRAKIGEIIEEITVYESHVDIVLIGSECDVTSSSSFTAAIKVCEKSDVLPCMYILTNSRIVFTLERAA